ncbi:LacI family transcriptional regulator [bacterium]|nr:MAG: LacI family transcriptional regulator [bacterium]
MRSTIRNVAEEAGVSRTTVSMVLRGIHGHTTPETRARVLEAASRLDYMPVSPPTSQNRPIDTRIVTLVPSYHDMKTNGLDMFTYQGIVSSARDHGYSVLTLIGHETHRHSVEDKKRYLDRHSDGFIFVAPNQGDWDQALELVSKQAIPAVICYGRHSPSGIPFIDVDNESAMFGAVDHLVQAGHRRIAYLGRTTENSNEVERRSSWSRSMREHGLDGDDRFIVQIPGSKHPGNEAKLASLLALGVTAVVCFNDEFALMLWAYIEAHGLKVPQDISIIGIDNTAEGMHRGLTSISHSFNEVGRLAMETWVELKNGGDADSASKLTPVELKSRTSVRFLET